MCVMSCVPPGGEKFLNGGENVQKVVVNVLLHVTGQRKGAGYQNGGSITRSINDCWML